MAELTPAAVLVAAIRHAASRTAQDRQIDIAAYVARSAPHYELVARQWLIREVEHLLMLHDGPTAGEVWEPVLTALRGPTPAPSRTPPSPPAARSRPMTTELTDAQREEAFGTDPIWAPMRELSALIVDRQCACTDDDACRDHELLGDLEQALMQRQTREGGFYLVVECGHCDEDIHDGPNLTTLRHEGLPVIPFDTASQSTFYCDRCRAVNYTGDFDLETEGGEDQDDEDEDDLDEADGDEEPLRCELDSDDGGVCQRPLVRDRCPVHGDGADGGDRG